mgnify:CR=1 FL=1
MHRGFSLDGVGPGGAYIQKDRQGERYGNRDYVRRRESESGHPDRRRWLTKRSDTVAGQARQPGFAAGMIPKSKAALAALDAGAIKARVIDGRDFKNLEAALQGYGGTVITHGK